MGNEQQVEEFLKASTPAERVGAVKQFYKSFCEENATWSSAGVVHVLDWCIRAADLENGWEQIAPAWLRGYRKDRDA